MCILMYMNIYISKDNEAWLRAQGTSMSGIVNDLLDIQRQGADAIASKSAIDYLKAQGMLDTLYQVDNNILQSNMNTEPIIAPPEETA